MKQTAKAKAALASQRADVKALLQVPAFERFVWRIIDRCGYIAPVVQGDGIEFAALRDGMRRVAIDLVADLELASPGTFARMLLAEAERIKAAERDRGERAAKRAADVGDVADGDADAEPA